MLVLWLKDLKKDSLLTFVIVASLKLWLVECVAVECVDSLLSVRDRLKSTDSLPPSVWIWADDAEKSWAFIESSFCLLLGCCSHQQKLLSKFYDRESWLHI